MLAHTVIIVTSGLAGKAAPDALDRALIELKKMKKTPILVLGSDGDEILRTCSELEKAEIVFDPNDAGDFSAVKAGLHATDAPAFIWSIDQKFPDTWNELESALRVDKFNKSEVLCLEGDGSGLMMTTSRGSKRLKTRPADAAWPQADDLTVETVTLSDLP